MLETFRHHCTKMVWLAGAAALFAAAPSLTHAAEIGVGVGTNANMGTAGSGALGSSIGAQGALSNAPNGATGTSSGMADGNSRGDNSTQLGAGANAQTNIPGAHIGANGGASAGIQNR